MASGKSVKLLELDKPIIGMVHVAALPGTPYYELPISRIMAEAVAEAQTLVEGGVSALIFENMHDRPYLNREVGPEVVAGMTAVGLALREAVDVPLGVQILAGANRQALAVAAAVGAEFIRAEGFVFSHIADEGLMADADAGPLLRYRKQLGCEHIRIMADIKKKHASHGITQDVNIAETAKAAEFFGADAVVVTGVATGSPALADDVAATARAVNIPTAIGSGVTPENLEDYWHTADAFIVGSFIKENGLWHNPVDRSRLKILIDTARQLHEEISAK